MVHSSRRACPDLQPASVRSTLHTAGPRDLVVVRAGRHSLHPGWVEGNGAADFDLFVVPYEQGAPVEAGPAQRYLFPGRKIQGYDALFRYRPDLLERYEYIAFFDDDLEIAKADINRLFAIGRRYRLDLFQPSLTWDSHFSYAATLTSGQYTLRYTNVVEMMCPVFHTTYLRRALPLFGLGYTQGIDLIWSRITDEPWFRVAIVDDVVVRHTRPAGTSKIEHTLGPDGVYDSQIAMVLEQFGATFRGIVPYAAIDRRGKAVLSRLAIAFASLWLWAAWRKSPMGAPQFVRFITDYTRHCLTRPINLDRIEVDRNLAKAASFAVLRPPGHSP